VFDPAPIVSLLFSAALAGFPFYAMTHFFLRNPFSFSHLLKGRQNSRRRLRARPLEDPLIKICLIPPPNTFEDPAVRPLRPVWGVFPFLLLCQHDSLNRREGLSVLRAASPAEAGDMRHSCSLQSSRLFEEYAPLFCGARWIHGGVGDSFFFLGFILLRAGVGPSFFLL